MSRAFVNEDDQSKASAEQPERPLSPHPNYVTPRGLAELKQRFESLTAERSALNHENSELTQQEHFLRDWPVHFVPRNRFPKL